MSLITLRGESSLQIYNQCVIDDQIEKFHEFIHRKIEVVNSPLKCLVCNKPHNSDSDGRLVKFIVHHLRYFPERVSFVHYECHQKIHNSEFSPFIQYNDGDSRMYYNMKENKDESGSTIKVRLESQ